jgi:hypothetical protein
VEKIIQEHSALAVSWAKAEIITILVLLLLWLKPSLSSSLPLAKASGKLSSSHGQD